jgi:hypothetical protein
MSGAGEETEVYVVCPMVRLIEPVNPDEYYPAEQRQPSAANKGEERRFRKTSDFWEVAFNGTSMPVKHTNGMEYIAHLLGSPGHSFGCVELAQAASRVSPSGTKVSAEVKAELSSGFTRHPVQSSEALARIKDAVDRIDKELADAEAQCDSERAEHLRTEKEAILANVKKSIGRGGRVRAFSDEEENARKAVSAAMARAIERMRKSHPALADHLKMHIKPGNRCCYEADGTDWDVEFG